MTEKRLTAAELDELAESVTGNPSLWSANIDENALLRAITELREQREDAKDCRCGRSMIHQICHRQENQLREQNAKLVAALRWIEENPHGNAAQVAYLALASVAGRPLEGRCCQHTLAIHGSDGCLSSGCLCASVKGTG